MAPRRLLALGLASLVWGCASTPRLTTPAYPLPDLEGAWSGTWGGTPLTLLVLDQGEVASSGGVSLGPWAVLAPDPLPGLSGVLTFTVRGEAVSVNVRGRLGDWNGRLALVLDLLTTNGQQLVLTHVDEHRMTGVGTSRARWEPQGAVTLARQGAESPAGPRR